jgi:hypothetical protein
VVCKECRYAVWPSQVVGHLTNKQHKLARKQAEAEWEEIQGWVGVAQYPSEFAVPPFVDRPIDELASYDDGIKCGLDDGECPYVCRGMNTMKAHWRKIHGFSAGQNRGGSGMLKREDIERRISEHCRRVRCQRFWIPILQRDRPSKGSTPYFPASANHSHINRRRDTLDLFWPARRSSRLTRAVRVVFRLPYCPPAPTVM